MEPPAEPAWSAAFTAEDWARLDNVHLNTLMSLEMEWAGREFTGRDDESTT